MLTLKVFSFIPYPNRNLRQIQHAANCQNADFESFKCPETLENKLTMSSPNDLVLVTGGPQFISRMCQKTFPAKVIYLVFVRDKLRSLELSIRDQLNPDLVVAWESELDVFDFLTILQKFSTRQIFGIDQHLGRIVCGAFWEVSDSQTKELCVDQLVQLVKQLGTGIKTAKYDNIANSMATVLDELILNAVFDANPRLQNSPRSQAFHLLEQEKVKVNWKFDGRYLGISVEDPFGQFHKKIFKDYLVDGGENLPQKQCRLSLGVGLQIISRRSDKLVINVDPGRRTEIISIIDFNRRNSDRYRMGKSIHYYNVEGLNLIQ